MFVITSVIFPLLYIILFYTLSTSTHFNLQRLLDLPDPIGRRKIYICVPNDTDSCRKAAGTGPESDSRGSPTDMSLRRRICSPLIWRVAPVRREDGTPSERYTINNFLFSEKWKRKRFHGWTGPNDVLVFARPPPPHFSSASSLRHSCMGLLSTCMNVCDYLPKFTSASVPSRGYIVLLFDAFVCVLGCTLERSIGRTSSPFYLLQ